MTFTAFYNVLMMESLLQRIFHYVFQMIKHDGATLKFHVRCATEFRKCYVLWRGPLAATLVICHPDTIRVIQSSNAPKAELYDFNKDFIGERQCSLYNHIYIYKQHETEYNCILRAQHTIYNSIQNSEVQCNAIEQCNAMQYKTIQYNAMQCNKM